MKTHCLLLGLALAPAMLQPAQAAVYFAAHQDDIVLLMGRNAQRDIAADKPTVLVILTAGDAGNGRAAVTVAGIAAQYFNQMGNPYFRVRHTAHEAAIASWLPPAHSSIAQRATEYFGPDIQAVEKVRIGNVTIYNLNLPDAFLDRFYTGKLASLDDVTGINRFTHASLRDTLRQIVIRNHQASSAVTINLPEHTPEFSAPGYNDARQVALHGDHADHTATGRFVRDAVAAPAYACIKRLVYMGYGISATADTMSAQEKLAQAAAYTTMNSVLKNQGNVSFHHEARSLRLGSMDAFHMGFYGKQRWRDGGGGGNCAFGTAAPSIEQRAAEATHARASDRLLDKTVRRDGVQR